MKGEIKAAGYARVSTEDQSKMVLASLIKLPKYEPTQN
jgi:DNA invertase Pin-like site-specific DNA recombinase